jgi:ABC-type glycerol-3-phosphate transport system substrate-binding protein
MLQPVATHPNTKDALEYLNALYNDGLINTDFPSMTSFPMMNERYLQAGKAGVGWVQNPNNIQMAEEDVEWAYIPPFSATGHEFARALGLANNGWISVAATSDDPQKSVDLLEYLNSYEGRQLMVAGVEGQHYTAFDEAGNFDRDDEAWSANYDSNTFPLYFYVGQGLMHGYVPVDEYESFSEALDHTIIFEPMPTSTGYREVIQQSGNWVGATNPFQFVEFQDLSDLRAELSDVIITGWTKLISADPDQFEAEWDAFLSEWNRVGGDEWVAAYQSYYDENLAN